MPVLIHLVAALALTGPQADGQLPSQITLPNSLLLLADQAEVSAREAGQLIAFEAIEGMHVEKDDFLAQIDDTLANMEKFVAQKEQAISQEEAESDINIQFSQKSAMVALEEYNKAIEANRKARDTITHSELTRRLFEYERAKLSIQKAQLDQRVAKLTTDARGAQVEAADAKIQMRKISAPISGVVVRLYKRYGEWVNPGDPVLRIIRMDRLWVEGLIDARQAGPLDLKGRPVTVQAKLARGRVETFEGKVIFVHPEIEPGQMRRIRAEVVNRLDQDEWLLQPGLHADLVIDFSGELPAGAEGTAEFAPNRPQGQIR